VFVVDVIFQLQPNHY